MRATPVPTLMVFVAWAAAASTTKGVHGVVVRFWQLAASRERRLAREWDVRVLGRPDRLETALLQRAGEFRRRHRIIGKEHRAAEMHVPLPRCLLVQRGRLAGVAGRRYRLPIL